MTLMPKDLPLSALSAALTGLAAVEPAVVASLWAKPRVRQPLKAMRRSELPRLSSRLSYAPVSLALSLMIRLEWATDLAQYKLRRIRLHKAKQKFLWS